MVIYWPGLLLFKFNSCMFEHAAQTNRNQEKEMKKLRNRRKKFNKPKRKTTHEVINSQWTPVCMFTYANV